MEKYPIALKVSDLDNVATIFADGICSGATVQVHDRGGAGDLLAVRDDIPYGHKIALCNIATGADIVKYGERIGVASRPIAAGDYVHVHNLDSMRGRGDLEQGNEASVPTHEARCAADSNAAGSMPNIIAAHAGPLPFFYGYPRPDGSFGARNHVAVIPSVTCAGDVAQAICRQVAGTVCYLHHQGCCQLPPDLERVTDTLIALGKSPNVGAVLIVSLGCEGTDHERMLAELSETGKPVRKIEIQALGGTSAAIAQGIDDARELVIEISSQQRERVEISQVTMAIKCGASDTTSGMASNCVIGRVADRLVDLGATVIFGETTEFIGGEDLLAQRAVTPAVAQRIYEIVDAMETRAKSVGCDMRRGQPTPGNIAGGLSSIEEKSLGAIVKSGTRPIQGVLDYPETAFGRKGLWIKDTPGREPEILTGMAATGAQFMCFSTGRGAPQGFPSMPVIKVCGNPHTFQRMQGDMDIDAGRIIEGTASIDEVADEAFERIIRVLSGELTKNEAICYTSSIDIHCLGPVI